MLFSEVVSSGPQFFYLVPLVVVFPLIGLLVNRIFGGRLPERSYRYRSQCCSGIIVRCGSSAGYFFDGTFGRRDDTHYLLDHHR